MRFDVGDRVEQVRVVGEPTPDLREARIAACHLATGELSSRLLAIQERADDVFALGPKTVGIVAQADARRATVHPRLSVAIDRHPAPDPHRNVPDAAPRSRVAE